MDLQKAIQDLYEEKARIDSASLEKYLKQHGPDSVKRKRGRKSMSEDERKEVSERMRSYWAARRAEKKATS